MNNRKLKRTLIFSSYFVFAGNLLFIAYFMMGFKNTEKKETFDEITVKRINIVDETGKNLRMVISNEDRQHPGIINGEKLPARERPSGIIFFNSYGDECGGLVYDGNENDAGLVLSVDKFRDDQIMQLQYMENTKNKIRKYGLQLWDYPKENTYEKRRQEFERLEKLGSSEQKKVYQKMKLDSLLMKDRLFVGKRFNKDVGLFINDKNGRPRIKIYVDEKDTPRIELLNKAGEIME